MASIVGKCSGCSVDDCHFTNHMHVHVAKIMEAMVSLACCWFHSNLMIRQFFFCLIQGRSCSHTGRGGGDFSRRTADHWVLVLGIL